MNGIALLFSISVAAELARLRELTGGRPAPAERSRGQRHPQAADE